MLINLLRKAYYRWILNPGPVFMSQNKLYSSYKIGEGSYGKPEVVFWDAGAQLEIGRYCSIAPGVTILLGGEHHHDWVTTYPFSLLFEEAAALPGYPYTRGDVSIGNDVWIGQDALVLSGVTIGDGAVVAARSVVAKDVAPYSLVGGVPSRHIRYRVPEASISALLQIAWWNWPWAKIKEALPLLYSSEVEAFIAKYGRDRAPSEKGIDCLTH